jgi:dCTP deaminase
MVLRGYGSHMAEARLAREYLGELLDRVIRFELHLVAVEKEFYRTVIGSGRGGGQNEPLFLESTRRALDDILLVVRELDARALADPSADDISVIMLQARQGMILLGQLHSEALLHLPRPSEPVELRRFLRMIAKHVLNRDRPDLTVYVTEETTETAFRVNPVSKLETSARSFRHQVMKEKEGDPTLEEPGSGGIHLTIARIDARNPLRWPALIHEAAHRLMSGKVAGDSGLESQFQSWLEPETMEKLSRIQNIELSSWLTEVWCDLFAALVLGPAFFFGQFAAFISSPPVDSGPNPKYPPHGMRLRLIRDYLRHRHPNVASADTVRQAMASTIDLVDYWDRYTRVAVAESADVKMIYDCFRGFFQDHFFAGHGARGEDLQKTYEKMVKYVNELEPERLQEIQKSLSEGLPAPSKPDRSQIPLKEEPTSIQEVLLAAWLDRLLRLRSAGLKNLRDGGSLRDAIEPSQPLRTVVDRFDDAVLRSLQLAEWLHVLVPQKATDLAADFGISAVDTPSGGASAAQQGLLCDREIAELILNRSLRIVPLVDLDQQLGSTSLDIRLGTSFEVYLPAYRRAVDAGDAIVSPYESGPIDLDFLEYIILLPGQIVLAHSFEYVKLPDTIAGDLEGRSSYARLGLQVHLTAGMIDPGFEGVITLELVNNGPNPIKLSPGVRIAQLRMKRVLTPARPYSRRHVAKYHGLLHHRTSLYMTDDDFVRIDRARAEAILSQERSVPVTEAEAMARER